MSGLNTGRYGRVNPGQSFGRQYDYTTSAILTADQDGALITNLGAVAAINLNLPPAVAGAEYAVMRIAPYSITVTASGTDDISDGPAGGTYVINDRALVVFSCIVNETWEVVLGRNTIRTYNVLDFGAVGDGVADDTAAIQAAHNAASAASPVGLVTVPFGEYKLTSTVELLASMHGLGGTGYSSTMGRAVFVSYITDGSATLRALSTQGLDLRSFAVEGGSEALTSVDPSTGNAQNSIGLQLGKPNILISGASKANPCVITSKYLHSFESGDDVVIENVSGMTELNGNTYTVTRIDATSFSIDADSTSYTTYTGGGLCYVVGSAGACSRGFIENITVIGFSINIGVQGWLQALRVRSYNGTLGFSGSQLNTCVLDLITENCWQAFQFILCSELNVINLEDEGGLYDSLSDASTIDACDGLVVQNYSTEGTRLTATPWINLSLISYSNDVYFYGGTAQQTIGGAKSVAVGRISRFRLPRCKSGYSVTAGTVNTHGSVAFATAATAAVTVVEEDDDYFVTVTGDVDERFWVTSKTTSGFTLNSSNATSTAVVDWHLVRN